MSAVDTDADVQRLLADGQSREAVTRLLKVYGAEVYGFLCNLLQHDDDAAEVFSALTEDVWKGVAQFRFECSARTWLYLLARHAASRYRQTPWRNRRVGDSELDSLADSVRSQTPPWQRTDVKDHVRALRSALSPDDATLLVLRVDRGLSWDEAARVFLGIESPHPVAIERESARLRKRFQQVRDELKTRAIAAGLLDS